MKSSKDSTTGRWPHSEQMGEENQSRVGKRKTDEKTGRHKSGGIVESGSGLIPWWLPSPNRAPTPSLFLGLNHNFQDEQREDQLINPEIVLHLKLCDAVDVLKNDKSSHCESCKFYLSFFGEGYGILQTMIGSALVALNACLVQAQRFVFRSKSMHSTTAIKSNSMGPAMHADIRFEHLWTIGGLTTNRGSHQGGTRPTSLSKSIGISNRLSETGSFEEVVRAIAATT
ncbi:hypothetical protein Hypma_007072 [Hypsizygus marmoreus]|uniref:Uncharacterized protein n=1 Tax=Hypsizygus marmoreus TaxID=39966 RepID=A0A369KEZ1_HYPMA|nr:hypothetical protein Hypma_007072 [Hypsizygus marmoreus]